MRNTRERQDSARRNFEEALFEVMPLNKSGEPLVDRDSIGDIGIKVLGDMLKANQISIEKVKYLRELAEENKLDTETIVLKALESGYQAGRMDAVDEHVMGLFHLIDRLDDILAQN